MVTAAKKNTPEGSPEKKLEEELRVRMEPDAKDFCTKLLGMRYKNASEGVRRILGAELKDILKENGENPKDFKPMLDKFK